MKTQLYSLRVSVRQRHVTAFNVKILHVSGGLPGFEAHLYQRDVNVQENVSLSSVRRLL